MTQSVGSMDRSADVNAAISLDSSVCTSVEIRRGRLINANRSVDFYLSNSRGCVDFIRKACGEERRLAECWTSSVFYSITSRPQPPTAAYGEVRTNSSMST